MERIEKEEEKKELITSSIFFSFSSFWFWMILHICWKAPGRQIYKTWKREKGQASFYICVCVHHLGVVGNFAVISSAAHDPISIDRWGTERDGRNSHFSSPYFVCESGRAEAAARATEAMRKIGGTKKKENRPISRRLDKMTLQPNRNREVKGEPERHHAKLFSRKEKKKAFVSIWLYRSFRQ